MPGLGQEKFFYKLGLQRHATDEDKPSLSFWGP